MCDHIDLKAQYFGGKWTEEKIEMIRKYLEAYTQALKNSPSPNKPFKLIYIDAFAGTGHYYIKSKEEEIVKMDGSAKVALELARPFHTYYFIDKDSEKLEELQELLIDYADMGSDFVLKNDDSNKIITDICNNINWKYSRAVMFLDPFGLQVSWSTIKKIAETKYIDLWFLFPIFAINRMLKKNGEISQEWSRKLDDVLGTHDWYEVFYRKSPQMSLWDDVERFKKDANFDKIIAYITARLKSEFRGVHSKPRVFKASNNSPLFALFFAMGNNSQRARTLAMKIAGHILND